MNIRLKHPIWTVSVLMPLMAASLIFSGCQPTPETEAIAQKQDINEVVEQYDQQDTGTNQSAAADSDSQNTGGTLLKEQVGAPDTVAFDLSFNNGKGKITGTDVPVVIPEATQAGAAVIVRADPDDETLRAMVDKFTGGVTLYEPYPVTKEDIMDSITRAQERINELKASGSEEAQREIPSLEEEIRLRQQSMDTVPSESELVKTPITWEWQKQESGMGYDCINGLNNDGDMHYSIYACKDASVYTISLSKSTQPEEAYLATEGNFVGTGNTEALTHFDTNTCVYTPEEAAELCMTFLKDYGISTDGLLVQSIEPAVWYNSRLLTVSDACGYEVRLCHGVGGIGQTYTDNHISYYESDGTIAPENEGRVPYDYEQMVLDVTDDGVIGFRWNNPMAMGEILSDNVALKSFDEIKTIMDQHLEDAYASYNSDAWEYGRTCEIYEISFGMMRIQNPDDESGYTLIPVWDVFGEEKVEGMEGMPRLYKTSLLTINAMDGTVISRESGY